MNYPSCEKPLQEGWSYCPNCGSQQSLNQLSDPEKYFQLRNTNLQSLKQTKAYLLEKENPNTLTLKESLFTAAVKPYNTKNCTYLNHLIKGHLEKETRETMCTAQTGRRCRIHLI